MKATILTIGDEILIGQVVNSNAAWLGQQLGLVGVDVLRMETVGDDVAGINAAIKRGHHDCDLVVVTGGLGPTHDDVTREAVASYCGVPLKFDPSVMDHVEQLFAKRNRPLPKSNKRLAQVPQGFDVLRNPKGTAPGLWGKKEDRTIVVLPGVPYEMKAIMHEHVLPRLASMSKVVIAHKTVLTVGQGESMLAEFLSDLSEVLGDNVSLAYLPGKGIVRLRVSSTGTNTEVVKAHLERVVSHLRSALGDRIFGEDEQTLEGVLGQMLVDRGLTIAAAESCTGGAVSAAITSVPGSSRYFLGGVIAYDNAVKLNQLGVQQKTLEEYGAVSEAVVRQMAEGVRATLGSDIGLATTGIAGPGGGSDEKPVGTVWLGISSSVGTHSTRLQLTPDRAINTWLSTTAALNLVRRQLLRMEA